MRQESSAFVGKIPLKPRPQAPHSFASAYPRADARSSVLFAAGTAHVRNPESLTGHMPRRKGCARFSLSPRAESQSGRAGTNGAPPRGRPGLSTRVVAGDKSARHYGGSRSGRVRRTGATQRAVGRAGRARGSVGGARRGLGRLLLRLSIDRGGLVGWLRAVRSLSGCRCGRPRASGTGT